VQVALTDRFGLAQVRFLNTHNANFYDRAFAKYTVWASSNGAFAGEQVELGKGTGTIENTGAFTTITLTDPVETKVVRFEITDYDGYGAGLNELQFFGVE